jgi:hypothetical protein
MRVGKRVGGSCAAARKSLKEFIERLDTWLRISCTYRRRQPYFFSQVKRHACLPGGAQNAASTRRNYYEPSLWRCVDCRCEDLTTLKSCASLKAPWGARRKMSEKGSG